MTIFGAAPTPDPLATANTDPTATSVGGPFDASGATLPDATHTPATLVAHRAQLLTDHHHTWMDPQVTAAFASSDMSDAEMLDAAHQSKVTLQNSWDGWAPFYEDPVLQKQPTTALTLRRYFDNTLGSWPIEQTDVAQTQQALQSMGYAKGLTVDGVWNPDWNAASTRHAQQVMQDQLDGRKPGDVTASDALSHFLGAVSPSGALHGLVAFVKSIPGDVRSLLADTAALGTEVVTLGQGHGSNVGAWVENMGRSNGDHVTAEEYRHMLGFSRFVNDIGTVLMFTGIGGAGTAVARAAGEEVIGGALGGWAAAGRALTTRGLTLDAATRGPGAVARTLLGGLEKGESAAALTGTRGLLPRAFNNIPGLAHMGPELGKLADADGLYYTMRTKLATPYRYSQVRAGGAAFQQLMNQGIKARALSGLENFGSQGDNTQSLSASMGESNVIDSLEDALRRGTHGVLSLDDAAFLLHGPLHGVGSTSDLVGQGVDRTTDRIAIATGKANVWTAFVRATGQSFPQLVKAAGSSERLNVWASNKVARAAANSYAVRTLDQLNAAGDVDAAVSHIGSAFGLADKVAADRQLGKGTWNNLAVALEEKGFSPADIDAFTATGKLDGPSKLKTAALAHLGTEAWLDRDLLAKEAQKIVADPHALAVQLRTEITRNGQKPATWVSNELSTFLDHAEILQKDVLPHANYLMRDGMRELGAKARREAQDEARYFDVPYPENVQGPLPGSPQWFVENHPHRPGSIGLQHIDRLTKQQALRDADSFTARHAAGADVGREMRDYLFDNFAVDSRQLAGVDFNPDQLAKQIRSHAVLLPTEMELHANAPRELRAAIDKLAQGKYRVVFGTDIGHSYLPNAFTMAEHMGDGVNKLGRAVEHLGLSTERFSSPHIAAFRRQSMLAHMQRLIDTDSRVRREMGLHYMTPQTVVNLLSESAQTTVSAPVKMALGMAAPLRNRYAKIVAEGTGQADWTQVRDRLDHELTAQLMLTDLKPADVVRTLTNPEALPNPAVLPQADEFARRGLDVIDDVNPIGLTERTARLLHQAMMQGMATGGPAYMTGLSKLPDLVRGYGMGLGVAGRALGTKVLGAERMNTVSANPYVAFARNLPANFYRLRNQMRFSLSPYFAFRRIAKQNVKLLAEGLNPVFNPGRLLVDRGDYRGALDNLDRLMPEWAKPAAMKHVDEALAYVHQQDIFALYQGREMEAWAAREWATQGLDDAAIRAKLVKVFHYGTRTGEEGRTALERSANTLFFPFSFEKTLYRNLGGHLLDHPGQAVLLNNALAAYHQVEHNTHFDQWRKDHAPILDELARMNAFAGGVGPGEFLGGTGTEAMMVDPALLNLFVPQAWSPADMTVDNLKKYIPVWNDFGRVMSEAQDQGHILGVSAYNGYQRVMNHYTDNNADNFDITDGRTYKMLESNKSKRAQIGEQSETLARYEDDLAPIFAFNAKHPDRALTWPVDDPHVPAGIAGHNITKESTAYLLEQKYHGLNAAGGAVYSAEAREAQRKFLDGTPDPQAAQTYGQFFQAVQFLQNKLDNRNATPELVGQIQQVVRDYGAELAGGDARFREFYTKYLRHTFGPIEDVTYGG